MQPTPAKLTPSWNSILVKIFFLSIQDKTVIDFGCGRGGPAIEMAKRGAKQVIGLDIQERLLATCREKALQQLVSDRCVFSTGTETQADILISKDAFEHFADPAAILITMASLIKPNGYVLAAFGPTWWHPYGGPPVFGLPLVTFAFLGTSSNPLAR
jgi:2-polyprenyl-3-methyl-5-hydroxy-6-metoxy-1,4-benzoquinol methylase